MISWNHPTNITSPVPSCQNASPLVLFLPKIRWSTSDLPRVLPGVDRWILTRWLHPQFVVSQETRLWSSLRSPVVSLDNLPSNCSVNSSRLQVFFASWLPKSPSRLCYLLSLDPYHFTGDQAYALEAALLFKVAVVLAIAVYRFWKSCEHQACVTACSSLTVVHPSLISYQKHITTLIA